MSCYAAKAPAGRISVLILATMLIGAGYASAQVLQPQPRKTPTPFGEMKIAPASLGFKPITFHKTASSESASFSIEDIGTAPLTVTIGTTSTQTFSIAGGSGQATLQPKGPRLVMSRAVCAACGRNIPRLNRGLQQRNQRQSGYCGEAIRSGERCGADTNRDPDADSNRDRHSDADPTRTATSTAKATVTVTATATSTVSIAAPLNPRWCRGRYRLQWRRQALWPSSTSMSTESISP